MAYHNRIRVHQAVALRERLLNDGLGLNEHRVLEVLAAKMARPPDPESKRKRSPLTITNTCYPSISTIAEYAILSKSAVNRAIKELIAHGYILKSKIPGYKLRKKNPNDRFDGNRYHLVPAIWDNAIPAKKTKEAAGDEIAPPAPTTSAADRVAEQAVLNGLDSKPAKNDSNPALAEDKYSETEAIIALLETNFRQHPTFMHKDATQMLTSNVRHCIDFAGAQYSCLRVFEWILADEDRCIAIFSSDRLGGFIKGAFKNWFAEFKAEEAEYMESFDDQDEDMGDGPESDGQEESVTTMPREITTTQAAYELSWQILVGLGHKKIKADAHRVLAQKLFPLIREEGYKDVKRTIEWMFEINSYWQMQIARGHNGDKCPIATFVARYHEFHPEAVAHSSRSRTQSSVKTQATTQT